MEENTLINVNYEDIKSLIYTVRGKQVILDSDIAKQYEVETKRVNEAVKRNLKRFPQEFCFQITESEADEIISQDIIFDSQVCGRKLRPHQDAINKKRNKSKLPYAFTEQGVAMLSAVLHSDKAIEVSIKIINAFIEMRKFIINNQMLFEKISNIELKQIEYQKLTDDKIEKIFEYIGNHKEKDQKLFFNGQIWDSYNLIVNIIKRAERKILIIDNYIDDSILEMLSKKKKSVEVVILTSNNSNILKLDIQKFNKEYQTLKIAKTDKFHDRFIIIDNKELYHCGASLKDLGKKCFGINRIDDADYIESLKKKVNL
ncbi:MAG: ORF6N domain-containing protein [Clostridia bacterium]|nr:ORF6N domain-containing protein [Clostridia bacterium]